MGWAKFIKTYEDEEWVVYNYSHDCEDYDGIVKVKKDKELLENNFIIIPSKSDFSNNLFALKVASQVYRWIKNDEGLLEEYMLAYG